MQSLIRCTVYIYNCQQLAESHESPIPKTKICLSMATQVRVVRPIIAGRGPGVTWTQSFMSAEKEQAQWHSL